MSPPFKQEPCYGVPKGIAMPTIEAINLTKQYGQFTALSDLNLKIEGSKCVGFLGPNGSGKTTTLKMFTDLIRPTKGQALINGFNVHTQKKKALESVGTLIETPEIYSALTPREGLMMIAEIRGIPEAERKKRLENAIDDVRMSEWIDKRYGKFSKGMKQRICKASALMSETEILLLDEPSTGLDPRGMSEVRDIVRSLKGKNRLIFMSSHILSEVSEICDEVAMIDHGKLIVYDTISNVTSKFSGGNCVIEVGLLRSIDSKIVEEKIASLPNIVSAEKTDDKDLRISFNGDSAIQERILSDLVSLRIGVITYKPAASELEDTYLKLIKSTL